METPIPLLRKAVCVLLPKLPLRDGNLRLRQALAALIELPKLPLRDGNRWASAAQRGTGRASETSSKGWKRVPTEPLLLYAPRFRNFL